MAVMTLMLSLCNVQAQDLSSAVKSALRIDPEILALKSNVNAAGHGHLAAEGGLGPRLSASAAASVSTDLHDQSDRWNTTLSASQSIYDGGLASSELRRTSAEYNSVTSRLADQELVVSLEAVQAYMEVQRSRGLVRILEAHVGRLQRLYNIVQSRVNAGVAGEVELYDTAAKIDAAKLNLIDARSQLADAVVAYRTVIGSVPGRLETIASPQKALPRGEDEAVRLALQRSPKIMAVRYDALAADATAAGYEAAYKPKLDLSLSAGHSNDFDGGDSGEDLAAQVSFRFDLYDGGTSRARARQARHNAEASRYRTRAAAREVEREMRLAWNVIRLTSTRFPTLQDQMRHTRRALDLSIKRYQAGVTALSQLLDLHAQAATAESTWLNAQFTYRYNIYRVLAGTGRLMKALSVAPTQIGLLQ